MSACSSNDLLTSGHKRLPRLLRLPARLVLPGLRSEGDGEARRITISNEGSLDRHIDVTSFAEIALAQGDGSSVASAGESFALLPA